MAAYARGTRYLVPTPNVSNPPILPVPPIQRIDLYRILCIYILTYGGT